MEHVVAAIIVIIFIALMIASRPGKCEKCGCRKERIYYPRDYFSVDLCPECDEEDLNEIYKL